jgi:hypothetical protein
LGLVVLSTADFSPIGSIAFDFVSAAAVAAVVVVVTFVVLVVVFDVYATGLPAGSIPSVIFLLGVSYTLFD